MSDLLFKAILPISLPDELNLLQTYQLNKKIKILETDPCSSILPSPSDFASGSNLRPNSSLFNSTANQPVKLSPANFRNLSHQNLPESRNLIPGYQNSREAW